MITERAFTIAATMAAVLVGLACGTLVWLSRHRSRDGFMRRGFLLASVGAFGAAWVTGTVLIAVAFPSFFAVIHWWYLLGVVAVPLLGGFTVAAGASPDRTRAPEGGIDAIGRSMMGVGVLMLLAAPLGLYATHIEPFLLTTSSVSMPLELERAGSDELRVAVVADLQTAKVGDHERDAIAAVLAASPDLILVPGDVLQAPGNQDQQRVPAVRELFAELARTAPTLVVPGNVDGDELTEILDGTGARLLQNEVERLQIADRHVAVGGLELDPDTLEASAVIADLATRDDRSEIRILLSHVPDSVLALPERSGIDLVVSGHTHGGQVALPIVGPLITLTDVPRRVADGGLEEYLGNQILVSKGIGLERGYAPQIRFGVPPEIVLVTLEDP